jgi:hypothetical protein
MFSTTVTLYLHCIVDAGTLGIPITFNLVLMYCALKLCWQNAVFSAAVDHAYINDSGYIYTKKFRNISAVCYAF